MGNWRAGLGCLMMLAITLYLVVMAPILASRRDDGARAGPNQLASPAAGPAITVRYYVTANSPISHARITYRTPEGTIEEVPDYEGPWDKVLQFTTGMAVSLSAQASTASSAADTVTCEIQLDGRPWKKEVATGPAATATCSGFAGQ
jgi:hypothetical protein